MLIDHSFTATLDNDSKYLNPEQPGIAVEIAVPNNFDLDLFYIAPFYHRCSHFEPIDIFPALVSFRLFMEQENLIVVDLDLEFMVGLDQVITLLHAFSSTYRVSKKTELYRIEHLQIG